jgi:hypothetical protein
MCRIGMCCLWARIADLDLDPAEHRLPLVDDLQPDGGQALPDGDDGPRDLDLGALVGVGTETGRMNRARWERTRAGSPIHETAAPRAAPMVHIPWAMTPSIPAARACRSDQWMGLKSVEAPA